MKIEQQRPTGLEEIAPRPLPTSRGDAGAARTEDATDKDTVALSPAARGLTDLRQQIGDPSEIDQDRVSSLRASLASGAYQPSLDAVAESLLREVAANSIA